MSSEGMPTQRLDRAERWEYRIAEASIGGLFEPHLRIDDLDSYLNTAGTDGWELVSTETITRNGTALTLLMILKRRRY